MNEQPIPELPIYCAQISICFQTPDGARERGSSHLFRAQDPRSAVDAAVRLARHLFAVFVTYPLPDEKDHWMGCIKVSSQAINQVAENGTLHPGNGWTFFEWKCDHPGTLDLAVQAFASRLAAAARLSEPR